MNGTDMQNALVQPLLTTCKYLINQLNLPVSLYPAQFGNKENSKPFILSLNIHIFSVGILSEPRNFPDEIQVYWHSLHLQCRIHWETDFLESCLFCESFDRFSQRNIFSSGCVVTFKPLGLVSQSPSSRDQDLILPKICGNKQSLLFNGGSL